MESNMKTWNKIAIFVSIISGLATLVTIIPIWLSLYFGQSYLYQAIKLQQVKRFNAKGYIFYKPIQKEPDGVSVFFLMDEKRTNSDFDSLKEGDILFATSTTNVRSGPTQKDRALFWVERNQCVVVLNEKGKEKKPVPPDTGTLPGGWIYVGTTSCPINTQ